MILRSKKNRRRVDVAKKTAEIKAVATSWAPTVFKTLGALVVTAGLVFGVIHSYAWSKTAPQFAIKDIVFHGNTKATDQELMRLGALGFGQNLVALDPAALEKSLAAHPWVKTVRVSRRFPSRLELTFTEHTAVAMVALTDLYLVDAEGEPFKKLQPKDGLDLPLVTGIDRQLFIDAKDRARTKLDLALDAARAFETSAATKGLALSEVHLEDDGVTVLTTSGLELKLGDGPFDDKLSRLTPVRAVLQKQGLTAEVIRLDNRSRPLWVTVQTQQTSTDRPERGGKSPK